jgi:hypothetical protein
MIKSLITILGRKLLSLAYKINFLEAATPKEVGEIRLKVALLLRITYFLSVEGQLRYCENDLGSEQLFGAYLQLSL